MRFWPVLLALFLLALAVMGGTARADVLYHWTQPLSEEVQSFRAVVEGPLCPLITVDATLRQMQRRAGPTQDFPNSVCSYQSDRMVHAASLGERVFPLSPRDAQKVLLIGDTGCRLRLGIPIQLCENGEDWPFATVAASLAKAEADIAIHLGDYLYREMECPDPTLCGSVYGDNWPTWEADFFRPAQVMLNAHPFIFVRGNHEKCTRNWVGFLRHFSVEPVGDPLFCDNYYPPFMVGFADLQLAVLDSSTRDRHRYTWDRYRAMRDQFLAILPLIDRETWVLTHAPLWGVGTIEGEPDSLITLETIQREAFGDMMPRLVSAVLSGDLHFAQIISVENHPLQLTFGNGGTSLYPTPGGLQDDLPVGSGVSGDLFGYQGFGFGRVERGKPEAPVTLFDRNGAQVGYCEADLGANSCVEGEQ